MKALLMLPLLLLGGCRHMERACTSFFGPPIVQMAASPPDHLRPPSAPPATPAGHVHCPVPLPPVFPDNDAALSAAPGLVGQTVLRKQGRVAREQYQAAVSAAVKACNGQ